MNKKVMMCVFVTLIVLVLIGGLVWKTQADKTNANAVNSRINAIVDKVSVMFMNEKKENINGFYIFIAILYMYRCNYNCTCYKRSK